MGSHRRAAVSTQRLCRCRFLKMGRAYIAGPCVLEYPSGIAIVPAQAGLLSRFTCATKTGRKIPTHALIQLPGGLDLSTT